MTMIVWQRAGKNRGFTLSKEVVLRYLLPVKRGDARDLRTRALSPWNDPDSVTGRLQDRRATADAVRAKSMPRSWSVANLDEANRVPSSRSGPAG